MRCLPHRPRRRAGVTLVEFAFVGIIFFMLLFGIIEYSKLIFTQQMMLNAAREGARFAVVNSTDASLVSDTQAYVQTRLVGLNKTVANYTCQVYAADSTGKNIGAPGNAQFGSLMGVQLDCDYSPILPSLLLMKSTIHLTVKSYMYSEAN